MALFGKPTDREDGGLVSRKTILPKLALRVLFFFFLTQEEGLVAYFLVPESFVHNVPLNLQPDNWYFSVLHVFLSP